MRRTALVAAAVLTVAAAAGAFWIAKRTIRWNDARTMPPPLSAAVNAYAKGDDAAGLDAVRRLIRRYRAPAWEPRARVLAACRMTRAGRSREIPSVLPKDLPPTDPLAEYARLLRARGSLAAGDAAQAAALAAGPAGDPAFPDAEDARLVLAEARDRQGRWRDAVGVLDAAPGATFAIAAARIAAAHGDGAGARRRLASALLSTVGAEDADALIAAATELIPDAADRFTASERPRLAPAARALLDAGRAAIALALLDLPRPAGAPSAATPEESLVEAEALLKLGRTGEAKAAVARARRGGAATQDGALYVDARIAAATGAFGRYRAGLAMLARRGTSPWKERALLDLARSVEGVPSASTLEAYRRYRLAAGASADPLALLREGWAAYEIGRSAEASIAFGRALAHPEAPDGVCATALYWLARLAEQARRPADATDGYRKVADAFPNHYYGILAARRLNLPAPSAPADAAPVEDPRSAGSGSASLSVARMLVSVGLWTEAEPFYRAAVKSAGTQAPRIALEAAKVALSEAAPSDAVAFALLAAGDRDRTRPDALPRGLWRVLYPAPPAEAIVKAARENGLDPNIVAAVALQESAFNPVAVSGAGARGLLQVMPAVGAELAATLKIKPYSAADLFDPETNLRLGCAHLRDYVRRFGSVPRALAAYNGGPARVDRWAAVPADDERFVERIPIPETRLYVKRVIAGARMYGLAWPDGLGRE